MMVINSDILVKIDYDSIFCYLQKSSFVKLIILFAKKELLQ